MRARSPPRRRLPPPHDPDRRGDRAQDAREGARDGRIARAGRLADALEPDDDRGGRHDADPPAAHRNGQAGDRRRGGANRDI